MIEPIAKDVFLRKSSLMFDDDVNIMQLNGVELAQQAYNKVINVQVVEVFEDEERNKLKSLSCFFRLQCGIRLLDKPDTTNGKVVFEIIAEHDVVFESFQVVDAKELMEFSTSELINTAAWPYWKEHVASLCSKAGMSTLPVPPLKENAKLQLSNKRAL